MVATLSLLLHLPECHSLKEKRSRIQPLMHNLRRKYNLSVAEMDFQDMHHQALITSAMTGNDRAFLNSALEDVRHWVEAHFPDGDVLDGKIEFL
jgi:uncharacterized protein